MADFTPSFTDDVEVIADGTVAKGAISGGTIDLRAVFGAFLFIALGRGGATALGTAISVQVRPTLGNNAKAHPNSGSSRSSSTAAATSTTVDGDSASGQTTLNVTSTTGFAAGDLICIQDSGGGVTRLEWARISKITNPGAGGELILDRNLQYTHTAAQADTIRNQADVFSAIWLPGGNLYEVIVDYGAAATGDTATLRVRAQRYDKDVST
ncbi:MAG: hypothetical protein GY778_13590 [bacterium]|nr:hypothetical protein [bacterium]